jgi:hypothetical protein
VVNVGLHNQVTDTVTGSQAELQIYFWAKESPAGAGHLGVWDMG